MLKKKFTGYSYSEGRPGEFNFEENYWMPSTQTRGLGPRINEEMEAISASSGGRGWSEFYSKNEVAGSGGVNKWLSSHAATRDSFFRGISPRAYSPEFMEQQGYAAVGGGAQVLDPMRKGIIRKSSISQSSFAEEMVGIERGLFTKYTSGGHSLPIYSYGLGPVPKGSYYMGRPTLSSMKKIYMTQEQALSGVHQMFGQTKYLASEKTGKPLLLGGRRITGRVLERSLEPVAEELAKAKPSSLLRKLQWMRLRIEEAFPGKAVSTKMVKSMFGDDEFYERAIGSIRKTAGISDRAEEYLSKAIEGIGGEEALKNELVTRGPRKGQIKPVRIPKKRIDASAASQFQKNIIKNIEDLSGGGLEKLNIRGYEGARELVEKSSVGTRLQLSGGITAKVAELSKPEYATIISQQTKRAQFLGPVMKSYAEKFGSEASAPDLFKVRLVRRPEWFHETYHKFATEAVTESGQSLGWLQHDYAREIDRGTQGLLKTEMFARIYPKKGEYFVKVFPHEAAAYKTVETSPGTFKTERFGWKEVPDKYKLAWTRPLPGMAGTGKEAAVQEVLDDIVRGRGDKYIKATQKAKESLVSRFPRKPMTDFIKDSKTIEKGLAGGAASKLKYGLMGIALAAGALFLWSATRSSRKRPLMDPGDIPSSMYGEPSDRFPTEAAPTNNSPVRVVNRQPGYDTNVNIETEDNNNTLEYNGLAHTMSSLSRNALGVNNANIDLNVTDNSRKVNSHSIQREFAEYLNR